MNDDLILVDLDDVEIGNGEKLWVHKNGKLHRAFSVFIIDGDRILLQRRNIHKYHSGGLWANACCSHPRVGETLKDAVKRRMLEELGVNSNCEELFHFVYRTEYDNGLTEYEYDHVFLCKYSGEVYPSEEEIDEIRWVSIEELKKDVIENPRNYASWFLIALPRLLEIVVN